MSNCKGVCRDCEHAERTSVWDQFWCTREDSTYYNCLRNGDEYCKAFEMKAYEKACGNCEYFNWDKRDKPCCYCVDHSMFEACEE